MAGVVYNTKLPPAHIRNTRVMCVHIPLVDFPSWRHVTAASTSLKWLSHTVPQVPSMHASNRPADPAPRTAAKLWTWEPVSFKRISPVMQPAEINKIINGLDIKCTWHLIRPPADWLRTFSGSTVLRTRQLNNQVQDYHKGDSCQLHSNPILNATVTMQHM